MIRLLIIVFALVVALGAGVVGLVHFHIIPDFTGMIASPAQGEDAPSPPPPPPPRVDPVLVDMPGYLIPVIRDGQMSRNLFIVFRIQVEPGKAGSFAFVSDQLRDRYRLVLYDMVPEQLETRPTIDIPAIKQRLMQITERVIGPGVVKDIVIQAVFER